MKNETLSHLSDAALVAEVERLARTEHDATVALVAHLAELGARKLHLAAGFPSLFEYCREVLALSEGEAYNRVVAARAVREFPVVLDRLADRSVNLTTIRLLFKHLTPENHRDLLDASAGKRKRDVERLVAARFPQPAVPFSLRKVPAVTVRVTSLPLVPAGEGRPALATSSAPAAALPAVVASAPAPPRPVRPATVNPIAEDQYRVQFTATAATWERLQAVQDLMRHSLPNGDVAEIVDRALKLLLEDLARRKFGATSRPRASRGTKPGSRDVPAQFKRAVWVRDCGRCAFVGTSGRRCTERGGLEFHHVHPFAAGALFYGPMREGSDTVREAIPGWDVSRRLSRKAVAGQRQHDHRVGGQIDLER
jgi:hypothetical protein